MSRPEKKLNTSQREERHTSTLCVASLQVPGAEMSRNKQVLLEHTEKVMGTEQCTWDRHSPVTGDAYCI